MEWPHCGPQKVRSGLEMYPGETFDEWYARVSAAGMSAVHIGELEVQAQIDQWDLEASVARVEPIDELEYDASGRSASSVRLPMLISYTDC